MCPKLTLIKKIPVIECEGRYDLITQVTTAKKEVPFYQDIIPDESTQTVFQEQIFFVSVSD